MESNSNRQPKIIKRSAYSWRATKALRTIGANSEKCPHCSAKLYADETAVPVSGDNAQIIRGKKCQRCDCLYVADKREAERILRDNRNAQEFTLDGLPLWDYTAKRNDKIRREQLAQRRRQKSTCLSKISTGVVLLTVKFSDEARNYVIVSNRRDQNETENTLHYTDALALELLTAAFRESRDLSGEYNGKNFRVDDVVYPQSQRSGLPEKLLPMALSIRPGGGLYSKGVSKLSEDEEIVDVLLYSPFTGRYEITRATYIRNDGCCYTDATLYRKFVAKYGRPGIATQIGDSSYFGMDWSNLRTKSALMQYGYGVGQQEDLRETYRQELLAELVDLELLDIPKIMNLLSFFISSHSAPKDYIARMKWEADKDFISAYKVNPQRFLIAR